MAGELRGLPVEDVIVRGNTQVSSAAIRNLIRTRAGDRFEPATVAEDYQRVYGMRQFSNVQALAERTATGVIVVFVVTEQRQINSITFRGNLQMDEADLRGVVDLKPGEAIDSFRISLARQGIENLYKDKNFPLAEVRVAEKQLAETGDLIFETVEGPNVRIRNVEFLGNRSFTDDKLDDQIKTASWVFIFRGGKYDPDQVEEDVAALRRFYQGKGFFDVRVGRKLVWSPGNSELEVQFVIDEGPQYIVDKIRFVGNRVVSDAELSAGLKLQAGQAFDAELIQRDVRQMVREYSKRGGYIFQPGSTDPDYLRIDAQEVFQRERGKVELVYRIGEGRQFKVGNIFIKGNTKSQDKLVYREFRGLGPGMPFNAAELADASERIRRSPFFGAATVTPIGSEPGVRDLLVEVIEKPTATFNIGAGVNSNGGIGASITYEQRNFDIGNVPSSLDDLFTDRAFTGAGQVFRVSLEPGTEQSNFSIRFAEPYLFDQPFSFSNEFYLRDREREHYDDRRLGDTVSFGHRFADYIWSTSLSLRWEQVRIEDIEDPAVRAQDILDEAGKSRISSVALGLRRDTTPPGLFPYQGSITSARAEFYGALGGDHSFQKFQIAWDGYWTLNEDLLDRKTVLELHADAGYITGDSVFYERFYGGGIGSVRGFRFRGISPRDGKADDPIGGDFSATATVQVSFPVVGDNLRGVVFTDFGTVEEEFDLGNIRASVGAGIRVILPFLGQTPLAIDLAVPYMKEDEDDEQLFSFSFGFIQ